MAKIDEKSRYLINKKQKNVKLVPNPPATEPELQKLIEDLKNEQFDDFEKALDDNFISFEEIKKIERKVELPKKKTALRNGLIGSVLLKRENKTPFTKATIDNSNYEAYRKKFEKIFNDLPDPIKNMKLNRKKLPSLEELLNYFPDLADIYELLDANSRNYMRNKIEYDKKMEEHLKNPDLGPITPIVHENKVFNASIRKLIFFYWFFLKKYPASFFEIISDISNTRLFLHMITCNSTILYIDSGETRKHYLESFSACFHYAQEIMRERMIKTNDENEQMKFDKMIKDIDLLLIDFNKELDFAQNESNQNTKITHSDSYLQQQNQYLSKKGLSELYLTLIFIMKKLIIYWDKLEKSSIKDKEKVMDIISISYSQAFLVFYQFITLWNRPQFYNMTEIHMIGYYVCETPLKETFEQYILGFDRCDEKETRDFDNKVLNLSPDNTIFILFYKKIIVPIMKGSFDGGELFFNFRHAPLSKELISQRTATTVYSLIGARLPPRNLRFLFTAHLELDPDIPESQKLEIYAKQNHSIDIVRKNYSFTHSRTNTSSKMINPAFNKLLSIMVSEDDVPVKEEKIKNEVTNLQTNIIIDQIVNKLKTELNSSNSHQSVPQIKQNNDENRFDLIINHLVAKIVKDKNWKNNCSPSILKKFLIALYENGKQWETIKKTDVCFHKITKGKLRFIWTIITSILDKNEIDFLEKKQNPDKFRFQFVDDVDLKNSNNENFDEKQEKIKKLQKEIEERNKEIEQLKKNVPYNLLQHNINLSRGIYDNSLQEESGSSNDINLFERLKQTHGRDLLSSQTTNSQSLPIVSSDIVDNSTKQFSDANNDINNNNLEKRDNNIDNMETVENNNNNELHNWFSVPWERNLFLLKKSKGVPRKRKKQKETT